MAAPPAPTPDPDPAGRGPSSERADPAEPTAASPSAAADRPADPPAADGFNWFGPWPSPEVAGSAGPEPRGPAGRTMPEPSDPARRPIPTVPGAGDRTVPGNPPDRTVAGHPAEPDPGAPADATVPVREPGDPADPADPADPTVPGDPPDATVPVHDPGDPPDPILPAHEPGEPAITGATHPTEPIAPAGPDTEAVGPADPTVPTAVGPADPTVPTAVGPAGPTDPTRPADPTVPDAAAPTRSADPTVPAAVDAGGPTGPTDPTVPGAADPTRPDDPTVPGAADPAGPGDPADSTLRALVAAAADPPASGPTGPGPGPLPQPPPPPPPPPPPAAPWAAGPYPYGVPAPGSGGGGEARAALRTFLRAPFSGRTWLEYLYLLAAAPLALAGFVAVLVGLSVGGFLTITLVGIPLVATTILLAREIGNLHRGLANGLLAMAVPAPRRARPKPGFFGWLRTSLLEVSGWRAVAYLVLTLPVTVTGLYALLLAWAVGLTMLSYPVIWQVFDPTNTGPDGVVHHSGMQFGEYYIETWPRALAVSAAGLVVLFLVPWVARAFTTLDRLLVRGLLGPTRLSERVVDLEATRAQAVDASAAELRRIERDLHDGTQARLVALAMHLDMAKEKLAGGGQGSEGGADLVRARDLLDTAHRNATEAIVELRDVTRSIHPPALDKGLDAALTTLAARSGVPATVRTSIAVRPSPAIETIAYFCVAELLTNVAKHSGADRATIDVTGDGRLLRLRVVDDGSGGAVLRPGGGLAGLAERVRTVDGRLDIVSPDGGPTVVAVDLPSGS